MQLPKHIPQLDVLRGVAVLVVIVYHAADTVPSLHLTPFVRLGYTGVDLFFVLSGFLITGILVNSKNQQGYFKNFYVRRALRIWPLYYALLLFTFIVLPAIQPNLRHSIFERTHPWQSFFFFMQNLMLNGQLNGQAFDTLRVTWSLAIEEQFYLVWPIVVWLAPRRMLKFLALSAVLVSVLFRWSVMSGLINPLNTYTNTLTRLDGLGMGAFLALWIPESESRYVRRAGIVLITLALPLAVAVGWSYAGNWSFNLLLAACFGGLLCVAINARTLSNLGFLKYTGRISYGLYLVHVPLFVFARAVLARRLPAAHSPVVRDIMLLVASFALCYALAAASWHFVESKILRWKSRFEYVTARASLPPLSALALGSENPGKEQPTLLVNE
ncbi:MAG: acyltransferase [Candidatus Acidiferrales bacterium]|jgi:peptidoglycan/LPS O-acetylase OafA/YrhL